MFGDSAYLTGLRATSAYVVLLARRALQNNSRDYLKLHRLKMGGALEREGSEKSQDQLEIQP